MKAFQRGRPIKRGGGIEHTSYTVQVPNQIAYVDLTYTKPRAPDEGYAGYLASLRETEEYWAKNKPDRS
mgnify:CR=1 FL=1